jgi:Arc/MetJ-type ribon-helix-helix transcriptional regulator
MLTNVTFALPDKTVRRLRKRVDQLGGRKGLVSEVVDDALTAFLDSAEESARGVVYTASKDGSVIATAGSLKDMAEALREKEVDPRSVTILSSEPIEPVVRLGLRFRRA